jgi:small subunit ribosomal protein S13
MEEKKKFEKPEVKEEMRLVRILGKDIFGNVKLRAGLTKIKGISWAVSNAICRMSGLNPTTFLQDLKEDDLNKIEMIVKEGKLPLFLKNRRKDFDEGDDKHIVGSDLNLRNEFDVKRLKKIKSYKGIRHGLGLPVRGQRTKSHFRKNRKKSGAVGVKGKVKK